MAEENLKNKKKLEAEMMEDQQDDETETPSIDTDAALTPLERRLMAKEEAIEKGELAERLGRAFTQLGAGYAGLKSGADLSNIQLEKTDWDRRREMAQKQYDLAARLAASVPKSKTVTYEARGTIDKTTGIPPTVEQTTDPQGNITYKYKVKGKEIPAEDVIAKPEKTKDNAYVDYRKEQQIIANKERIQSGFEKQVGKMRETYDSIRNYESQIDEATKNPVVATNLLQNLVRATGEVGNLNQSEREMFLKSGSALQRIQNRIEKETNGVLTPELSGQIKELVSKMKQTNQKALSRRAKEYSTAKAKAYGMKPGEVLDLLQGPGEEEAGAPAAEAGGGSPIESIPKVSFKKKAGE